jgi:RecA/RadA recombinase
MDWVMTLLTDGSHAHHSADGWTPRAIVADRSAGGDNDHDVAQNLDLEAVSWPMLSPADDSAKKQPARPISWSIAPDTDDSEEKRPSAHEPGSRPVRPLPELLEALRGHGVRQGVDPGPMVERGALPTGHPQLDAALHTGGWPQGALALLDASLGSGATSLALGSLAACQSSGGLVAYLDPGRSLDPATAARLGVNLEWLLIVRPADAAETVELAAWLARDRSVDAFVLDLTDVGVPSARLLDRLADLLVRSGAVGLMLAGAQGREAAGRVAGVRVALQRRAWLAAGTDMVGQRVEATVTRHRWALAGGRTQLDLWFAEGRRSDSQLRAVARPLEEPVEEQPALRVVGA